MRKALVLLLALVPTSAWATVPVRATVRGAEVQDVEVVVGGVAHKARFDTLSRTRLDPGPVTLRASVPGDRTGVEVAACAGRGAVVIDGVRYAPPPGPFVVRLAPRSAPHSVEVEIGVSSYERRVACGDPLRAGAVVDAREGIVGLDFPSPVAARGGGHALMYVPPGHDATKPAVLLVGVHPWNGTPSTYTAYAELLAAARQHDVVLLFPSGLGNSLYTAPAESETMRAIDAASRALAIDPRRVSIWGASMGGQGACTIGLHHPDRFAFIASYFGDASFNIASYVRSILPTQEAAHRVNPIDVIDNARHVPGWLIHGDADRTSNVHESELLDEALRQRGYAVRFDKVPGRGHEGMLVAEHVAEVVARAAQARSPEHPARVTFRTIAAPAAEQGTVRPEDDRAYGVRIVRAGAADAFVDLELSAGKIVVHAAEGVREIVLGSGALGAPRGTPVVWSGPHGAATLRWE
ncbi:MAG TPA: prolyl oligopeptidase family serine peptidase [Polyangiaceae bacterium]|nr:prolyl oligopeptidase family serine peptidase [Polyangiaceae bacterium]